MHVVVKAQQLAQRVHGAAVLQISDQGDAQTVDAAPRALHLPANGVEVQQRLARVLVGSVAGVDHRHPAGGGKFGHRAGLGVAHHDDVAVAGQHPSGIEE